MNDIFNDRYVGPNGIGSWHDYAMDGDENWEIGTKITVNGEPATIISRDEEAQRWFWRLDA